MVQAVFLILQKGELREVSNDPNIFYPFVKYTASQNEDSHFKKANSFDQTRSKNPKMEKSAFFPQVSKLLKEKFLIEENKDYWVYTYFYRFEKTHEKCKTFSVISNQGKTICQWYEARVNKNVYLFMNISPKKKEDIGWAWEPERALKHIEKTINNGNSLQELYREKLRFCGTK